MTDVLYAVVPLLTVSLISCVGLAIALRIDKSDGAPPPDPTPGRNSSEPDQQKAEQQSQEDIEHQQARAKAEAEKAIDKDAVTVVEETRKAVAAIAENKNDEAIAAMERARGKVNSLLSHNAATAVIPVDVEAEVFDVAPGDPSAIMDIAKDVSRAVDDKDFPAARALLHSLMSEVRIRTYNLPLVTFPLALNEAAHLMEQKKAKEASAVLVTALRTLVVADRISPIPLLLARENVSKAQKEKDKAKALKFLEEARTQIERSRDLGYAGRDPGYVALNNQIENLEKQMKGGKELTELYSKVKERLASFLKEQSEQAQS